MQRYLVVRVFQTIIALLAVTVILFGLGRVTRDPLDVLLPAEATQTDYELAREAWGLDKPIYQHHRVFMKNAFTGNLGESWKWN